ncbi:MAG: thiamine diphosphokinase [Desulfobulbaceae bacterium]|nr:thiamine diphosphokinase [Desulfobulbaceae bacterium]
MRAVIFVNGELEEQHGVHNVTATADLIIAADGGANHCARLGITPDILIGDLDSIDPVTLATYRKNKVVIERHPVRKDATDLELAVDFALKENVSSLHILAALGGRWDMSLANILLLANSKYKSISITLESHDNSMRILHPGTNVIDGKKGQRVSLLPLQGDAMEVSLIGFEYPLAEQDISFGSTLGVSNVLINTSGTIKHKGGILLAIFQN